MATYNTNELFQNVFQKEAFRDTGLLTTRKMEWSKDSHIVRSQYRITFALPIAE